MAGTSKNIHEHGIDVDKKKHRVKCRYCMKEVNSFNRLKFHLSGVIGVCKNLRPCEEVTKTVRETYLDMVKKDKPGLFAAKRVGEVQGNGHKRARSEDSSSKSVSAGNGNIDVEADKRARSEDSCSESVSAENGNTDVEADKCARSDDSSSESVSAENENTGVEADKRARSEDSCSESVSAENGNTDVEADKCARSDDSSSESVSAENENTGVEADKRARSEDSSSKIVSAENGNTDVEADKQYLLSNNAQKRIGRFFYENCIDFSAVDSPSFKEMLTVCGGGLIPIKFPDSHELKGRILQETVKEVQEHVKKIKDSWEITGCSILLDAWVDQEGRDLVTFVADSPAGLVYLRSFNVSDIKSDAAALLSLVDGLLEDVGVRNVIQIIACSNSGWVGELGKLFAGNKREVFWSVSLSHCIKLMLVKIGEMDSFGDILDKVSNIWEFIKNNPSVFGDYSHGTDMITTVSSSEYEFVTPYLTLESIFKAKSDLEAMFALSDWNKEEGIAISKLVNDSSFWETVERFVKCTSSLVHDSLLFSNANVGYIYDTIDGIKVSIARQFNHEKLHYKALWDVIDDVWNEHLHSPLLAAGYFLNPAAFYSTEFHSDPEVTIGLISTLVRVVKESPIQIKIASQLDVYGQGKDCYKEACQADQIGGISPVEWWAQNASQHRELQSFAIKILSQTCQGASKYKLKRNLAEKLLLTEGMSRCEQKHLEDLAFVHYNLHLQSCKNQTQ